MNIGLINMKEKLHNKGGETLTETLVAVLIAALALVMFAGAISASKTMIERSTEKLNQYYINAENMNNRASGNSDSYNVNDGISCLFSEQVDSKTIVIPSQPIIGYENEEFNNKPVIAYALKVG